MSNPSVRELARSYVRMKQADVSEEAEAMSLDPRPVLPPPEPESKPARKRPRRVFPFKRHKVAETPLEQRRQ